MNQNLFIAQATAQIPDCPAHQVSAYLLEFVEKVKTSGNDEVITLNASGNQGYSAPIPDTVLHISEVFVDGQLAQQSLTEASAFSLMNEYPDNNIITDDNNDPITDDGGNPMEA